MTSLNTPINWRQEHARVDYTINSRARVMVRYTQDSWTNKSPSAQETLWGDDPFPAVDSNWSQPGRSLTAQLAQNLGDDDLHMLRVEDLGDPAVIAAKEAAVARQATAGE